jgi:hypothetical protein
MKLHNITLIFERSFAQGVVIIKVVPKTLTEEVEAVEMVESFHVRGIAAAVFTVDLYLVVGETRFFGEGGGHNEGTVVKA